MRCLTLACALALLPSLVHADDVFLQGGGKISGRILSRTDTSVEVDVGPGTITVPMTSVVRIEKRRSILDDYHERAEELGAADASGWLQLARWASSQGLGTQARSAFQRVLAVDPENVDANEALGRVRFDGRWVTEAESYRARGFVQFEGQWLTAADRDAILQRRLAADTAEAARLDAEMRVREAEARAAEAEARARAATIAAAQNAAGIPLWWGAGAWGWSYQPYRKRPVRPHREWPPNPVGPWPSQPIGLWPSQPIGMWPSYPIGMWPYQPADPWGATRPAGPRGHVGGVPRSGAPPSGPPVRSGPRSGPRR